VLSVCHNLLSVVIDLTMAARSSETYAGIYQAARRSIAEDFSYSRSENLKFDL
jgi:hypothetical protein